MMNCESSLPQDLRMRASILLSWVKIHDER
jgi:hypothetical protein